MAKSHAPATGSGRASTEVLADGGIVPMGQVTPEIVAEHAGNLREIRQGAMEFLREHPTAYRSAKEAAQVVIDTIEAEHELAALRHRGPASEAALAVLAEIVRGSIQSPGGVSVTITRETIAPPPAPRRVVDVKGSVQ